MTKKDMIRVLESMDDDKVIVYVGADGGWSNIDELVEGPGQIELTIEQSPVFDN